MSYIVATLGSCAVLSDGSVRTPLGLIPPGQTHLEMRDHTLMRSHMSGAAIAWAILLLPITLGLSLFFLVARKREVAGGHIEVLIHGPAGSHVEKFPPGTAVFVQQQVGAFHEAIATVGRPAPAALPVAGTVPTSSNTTVTG